MREPAFWSAKRSLPSRLLSPTAAFYGAITASRMQRPGARAGIPVICVGNFTLGGAGKTPTVLAVTQTLRQIGATPFVLSRGYGGSTKGSLRVDPGEHDARTVGDEPLMMARHGPVIVSSDRVAGATLARSQGADVIVMDDGFQNPSLHKDLSLIVVDSHRGLGNGMVFPAGPLRAPLAPQLARTDALVVIGDGNAADDVAALVANAGKPVLRARIVPDADSLAALRDKRVLAFAGIGDPARFFATLRGNGIDVAAERAFADHHAYSRGERDALVRDAARDGLALVTTEKDVARLGRDAAALASQGFSALRVRLVFEDLPAVERLLMQARAQLTRAGK